MIKQLTLSFLLSLLSITSFAGGDVHWVKKTRQVTVYQRSSVVLDQFRSVRYPEVTHTITLQLGDITRRQVLVKVSFKRDGDIVKTRSIHKGDTLRFRFQDIVYQVTCDMLINRLIHNDYAIFTVIKSRQVKDTAFEPSSAPPSSQVYKQ